MADLSITIRLGITSFPTPESIAMPLRSRINFVGVDRILGEGSKMLETLMKFSHQNKWHMRDRVTVVAHPSLRFFIFDHLDELVRDLIEQWFGL